MPRSVARTENHAQKKSGKLLPNEEAVSRSLCIKEVIWNYFTSGAAGAEEGEAVPGVCGNEEAAEAEEGEEAPDVCGNEEAAGAEEAAEAPDVCGSAEEAAGEEAAPGAGNATAGEAEAARSEDFQR